MMDTYDPRAGIVRAIAMARVNAGVNDAFNEVELAVINDLLDRVRVPGPVEISPVDAAEFDRLAAGHG